MRQLLVGVADQSRVLAGVAGFAVSFGLSALVVRTTARVPARRVHDCWCRTSATLLAATTVAVATGAALRPRAGGDQRPGSTCCRPLKDESATSTASHRTGAAATSLRHRAGRVVARADLIGAGLFLSKASRGLCASIRASIRTPSSRCRSTWIFRATRPIAARRSSSRFVERAAALPGVTSVATADVLPFGGEMYGDDRRLPQNGAKFAQAAHVSGLARILQDARICPLVRGRRVHARLTSRRMRR